MSMVNKAWNIFSFFLLLSCSDSIITSGFSTNPGSSSSSQNEIVYTLISSVDDLNQIRQNLSVNYALTQDIDLDTVDWQPIGDQDTPFTGRFNGNNYQISNVSYTGDTYKHLGFYGHKTK